MTLLHEFIREECTPYVRRLLEEALAAQPLLDKRFEFNRFEVAIEGAENSVLIEDVLDATDSGAARFSVAEFATALADNLREA